VHLVEIDTSLHQPLGEAMPEIVEMKLLDLRLASGETKGPSEVPEPLINSGCHTRLIRGGTHGLTVRYVVVSHGYFAFTRILRRNSIGMHRASHLRKEACRHARHHESVEGRRDTAERLIRRHCGVGGCDGPGLDSIHGEEGRGSHDRETPNSLVCDWKEQVEPLSVSRRQLALRKCLRC